MSISFNVIPINLRVPGTYIEVDNSRAIQGLLPMPSVVLMFGQMLSTGTATADVPVLVTRTEQAPSLFGQGSMLAAMVETFKDANRISELYVIPQADAGSSTKATLDVTVSAAPTASGTFSLYIGGQRVRVGVTAGDTTTQVATDLAAAISAAGNLPMTASASAGVVTLTASHGGIDAGAIDVRHSYQPGEQLPDGMAVTIGTLTAGTANPDITTAIDNIGDNWYQTLIVPYTDTTNLGLIEAELADRFGPLRQIPGHAFTAKSDTVSNLTTAATAENSEHLTYADGGVTIAPSYRLAAADAAVDAGEPDPARPRQTLALPAALLPVTESERRVYSERNTLLYGGVATHTIDAGGLIRVERLITTYQTNASGVDDPSYLDVTTMRTLSYMRYTVRNMVLRKYPRHKLADDGTPIAPGQAIVTPNVMRAELVSLFMDWQEIGIAEDLAQFKRDLIVERNQGDPNRLDAVIPPDVINQLRVFAGQLQFRL